MKTATSYTLTSPVTRLVNVAEKTAQRLQKIGITAVFDLLLHLPIRYEDKTTCTPIAKLINDQEYLIFAKIIQCRESYGGRRKSLQIILEDDSGQTCHITLFHYRPTQYSAIQQAMHMSCYGKAKYSSYGVTLLHPQYRLFKNTAEFFPDTTLTPLYSLTQGLQQQRLRKLINVALDTLKNHCIDESPQSAGLDNLIPAPLREKNALLPFYEALKILHNPGTNDLKKGLLGAAKKSIAFEELLAHQLGLRQSRLRTKTHAAPRLNKKSLLADRLLATLPFKLTAAQKCAIKEILNDCCDHSKGPMLRLLQGDVGCGKTVVAAIIALHCLEQGWQCAIMVPTELLAMQHLTNFQQWMEPLGINVKGLTSKSKQKKQLLTHIKAGDVGVIIGTQALIQEQVQFSQLGLCIIDEQHRFGVHQRLLLKNKGQQQHPHQLIMTATPIPRSLAMTFYADLDLSVIDELPASRQPVDTVVLPEHKRNEVIYRLEKLCRTGRQAYWVCPLIKDSEDDEENHLRSTEQTLATLQALIPATKIALVHGQMHPEEKLSIMQDFKQGKHQLLVSTTVIEVGIDVPNATLMIIENADRLGLSQLHQLRGRVGRGSTKSYCVLMYGHRLGANGKERLAFLRKSNNGFDIAQKDLKMRGPGEFLGLKQSGALAFRVANLEADQKLLPKVQETADTLLKKYPEQAQALLHRWMKQALHYNNV